MRIPVYILGNGSHQPISVNYQAGEIAAVGDVPQNSHGLLTITPGKKVVIEQTRVNYGQLHTLAAKYGLIITESYSGSDAISRPPPPIDYSALIMASNPLAYWRLDETSGTVAHDQTGSHDGTFSSDIVPTLGIAGPIRTATSFSYDYIARTGSSLALGTLGTLGSNLTNGFSFECWMKPEDVDNYDAHYNWPFLFGDAGSEGISLTLQNVGDTDVTIQGQMSWYISDSNRATLNSISLLSFDDIGNTLPLVPNVYDGSWHHVAVVWDGQQNAPIYIDGQPIQITTTGTRPTTFTNFIDRYTHIAPTTDYGYNGGLAEVAIYNRALTANEIADHYAAR